MPHPENQPQQTDTESFEDNLTPPDKNKDLANLTAWEKQRLLSEQLYQMYIKETPNELNPDEAKLVTNLISSLREHVNKQDQRRDSVVHELNWLLKSYWPMMIAAGSGVFTAHFILVNRMIELMIPSDVFLNDRAWQSILESESFTKLMSRAYTAEHFTKAMIAIPLLVVTILLAEKSLHHKNEVGGSFGGLKYSVDSISDSRGRIKTKVHDLIHLLGINELYQMNSDELFAAALETARRVESREDVLQKREDTIKRRRAYLEKDAIPENSEIWDRSDDFDLPLEDEVQKHHRAKRK
jgi:hypothetical protein